MLASREKPVIGGHHGGSGDHLCVILGCVNCNHFWMIFRSEDQALGKIIALLAGEFFTIPRNKCKVELSRWP